MFEEQRNWLQRFHRSEVKATVVEAAPAKPAVVPQGAQWAGIQKKPATGLPPGWTPIDLPADFAEVFGYEEPAQRRVIPPEDFARDETAIFAQVHQEANAGVEIDRLYDPQWTIQPRSAETDFLAIAEAEKAYKQTMQYKTAVAEQQKASLYSTVIDGDGYRLLYDGNAVWISGSGAVISPQYIPLGSLDSLIADLQGIRSGKSSPIPKHVVDRYAAEARFQQALATGIIEVTNKNGDTKLLSRDEWGAKLHG